MLSGNLDVFYWKNIIERLYDQQTCDLITERVLEQIHSNRKNKNSNMPLQINGKRKSKSPLKGSKISPRTTKFSKYCKSSQTIEFESFVKVLLRFQLDRH